MTSDDLAARLTTGWAKCDHAPPDKRLAYDDHWIDLLHQLESACYREGPDAIKEFNRTRHCRASDGEPTCQSPAPASGAENSSVSHQASLQMDVESTAPNPAKEVPSIRRV